MATKSFPFRLPHEVHKRIASEDASVVERATNVYFDAIGELINNKLDKQRPPWRVSQNDLDPELRPSNGVTREAWCSALLQQKQVLEEHYTARINQFDHATGTLTLEWFWKKPTMPQIALRRFELKPQTV